MPPRRIPLASMTGESRAPRATDPLRAALALLTRLPVHPPSSVTTGAAAFPIVGAGLGAVAVVPLLVLPPRDGLLAAILALALLAVFDGVLHLDGLADTADGLAAPDASGAERARTDPRIGAAGATALVLVLAVDATSIALLAADNGTAAAVTFVGASAAARGTAAILAPWLPRRERGFGAWFGEGTSPLAAGMAALWLAVVALVLVGMLPELAPAGLLAGAAVTAVALIAIGRHQAGLTGDGYGAAIELGFAASLGVAAIVRP